MSQNNWLQESLTELEAKGLRRLRRESHPLSGGRVEINGKTLWNFAANDYLGLASDPRLASAAIEAIRESGLGSRASALVTGRSQWHAQLESHLAEWKGAEAAILFPSGYAANQGTIAALVGKSDAVYCDRLNHASLIDGCKISQARFRVYPHNDTAALRRELNKGTAFERRLIVTDSVFSMDGDLAPLPELAQLADEFDAILLVDEAHASGVFGNSGGGLLEHYQLHSDRIVSMGTLSKAMGLQGGFVTGSDSLIDWLWNSARTQIYSTALPNPICAAAVAAINIIRNDPLPRTHLLQQSLRVTDSLRNQGWEIPDGAMSAIIPIIIGDASQTVVFAKQLEERGVLVAAIRPPTVPNGTSRLRISLSVAHGENGINALIQAMSDLRRAS
ncbi:8-amino-7-oxononanoate synthase [Planctomicrobium sp. SH668]|uniref:8-amino-7-oxononanoate synthase n=1 Tax=Planctomicrobium sp. SH668 TaxID=3448126 RepID=UPI003F5C8D4C